MNRIHRYVVLVAVAVLVAWFSHAIGKGAKVDQAAMAALTREKARADSAYQRTVKQLADNKEKLARLHDYDEEVADLTADISTKTAESNRLSRDIKSKSAELASLTQRVKEVKSRPTIIPAGHHVVGSYIRAGRYTVTGSSNFVVHDSSGELKVNTILGGNYGVDSYVCDLDEGDSIRAESRTYLYPWTSE